MNYGNIKNTDIANGEGVRVSLFVSGCRHHCKGCFNPETWSFKYGNEFTKEVEDNLINMLRPNYIKGLTLLGGEPMEPENQQELVKLLRRIKKELPEKDIWCYSGYTYDKDLKPTDGRVHTEVTDEILSYLNVLVDGQFVEELKDITLNFRGSSNQRLINVPETLRTNSISLINL